ncbi:iron complex outermembrane receptor protein [Undibacterium sp. GrIS 1.8]|uniref:TonB-dependent receptor domain-containing protein n=1 Tax=Undibacterium sp. GrIS 1.8 TaxID=3143934 RepID=UPI0033957E07
MIKEKILSRSVRIIFSSSIAVSLGLLTQPAFSQEETTAQRVEITGSSIKRAEKEASLPVQVVSREDIQKLGVTSSEQLLSSLTANSAVGGTTTAQGAGASTYGLASASLRSLGANKTLVLVNGRRLANYATDGTTVDINSIPLSQVDHVEILKDGASGVYGSDAIGGVINFILRKNFVGLEATGYASGSTAGGGQTQKAGVIWGFGDYDKDRFNIMLSADLSKDTPIYGSQRSYANHTSDEVNGLFDQSATPSGALRSFDPNTTANAGGVIPNSLNSQGAGLGNPLSPGNCGQNGSYYAAAEGTCRFNSSPFVPLTPDIQRSTVAGSFRFKLTEKDEFFIDAFASHTVTKRAEQPSPYSVSFLATDNKFATQNVYPAIIISPTSPYYPSSYLAANHPEVLGQPVTVSYRAFDGGGREQSDTANQGHFVSGFRGTVKDYDYDIAYSHNSSSVSEATQAGYQNQVALAQLLSNNNSFNPFVQYQNPALAAQIKATNYVGNMLTSTLGTDSLDGKISGELFKLPAGMVDFAVGASVRNETMDFVPSAAFQSGDISGYGGQALPLSASRHSSSIFGELAIPIVKMLEADLALRTDKYPNATSTNPKISFRLQPVSQLLIRASYGTGFREPALPELYTQQTVGTTASFKDPVTGVKNQFTQLNGGNPNLKPEKSEQSSVGFVLDVTKDLSMSVDYWKINVSNLVTALDPQFIVQQAAGGNAAYTGLVQRDSAGNITQISALNLNAGGMKTAGVDVDVKWRLLKSPEYGNFSAHLNGTYTNKFDFTLPDGTVQPSVASSLDVNGAPLNAVNGGGIIFRWRHQLEMDWSKAAYGVSLIQNYQSGYADNVPQGFSSQTTPNKVGSFQTWDLQASYTGFKNLTLRLGVKNLLDKEPPLAITLGQYFQTGYDPSYYDPHGRVIYTTATYKF